MHTARADFDPIGSLKRQCARCQLIEDAAERVHVRPLGDGQPGRLLRRPVLGATDARTIVGQVGLVRAASQDVGQTKVGDAQMPIVAIKDVAGLEIAMRDATGMCVRQPARDRQSDLSDLRPRKWRVGRTADERATTAVLLHEKWCGWRVIEVEHLHDVRVPQLGECRGFAAKALVCALISGDPRMQHLDRHETVES